MSVHNDLNLSGVSTFLADLASDTPAPGGGASAAVIGAIACAQSAMVAGLSLQNITCRKDEACVAALSRLREQFLTIQKHFLSYVADDAHAYTELSAVFKMPRDTSEEVERRHALLQKHLVLATIPPFEVLHRTQEALASVAELAEYASSMTKTDLIVASLALKAAARGGEAMVRANTMYLSDAQEAAVLEEKARVLAQSSDNLSQDIYHAISSSQNA